MKGIPRVLTLEEPNLEVNIRLGMAWNSNQVTIDCLSHWSLNHPRRTS